MSGLALSLVLSAAAVVFGQSQEATNTRNAYVTLLCDPLEHEQADYIRMLLVLKESIRQFDQDNDIITMVHGYIGEEQWELLDNEGIKLLPVEPVASTVSNPEPLRVPDDVSECYLSKLHALELTQYEKIIYLDTDMLVKQDLRSLFDGDEFIAYAGIEAPLNAGLFAVRPSVEAFNEMQSILASDEFDPDNGWQNYGPFPHWRLDGHMSDWTFWCAHTDQGILYYYFDKLTKTATIYPMQEASELVTHFTGIEKPVLHTTDEMRNSDKDADGSFAEWYKLWASVEHRTDIEPEKLEKESSSASAARVDRDLGGGLPYCNPYDPIKVTVYDAASDTPIGPLGHIVSCGGPPKTMVVTPECKYSVKFKLIDEWDTIVTKTVEKVAPLSLGSDIGDDLLPVPALDVPGWYKLEINAFPGGKQVYSFDVVC